MEEEQRPRGPKHLICPFHKVSMAEVCDTCPLWVKLVFQHPQKKDSTVDKWDCAIAWGPIVQVETGHRVNQMNKTMDETRTDFSKSCGSVVDAVEVLSQQIHHARAQVAALESINTVMEITDASDDRSQ